MILDNKGISQKKFFVLSVRAGYKQELFYSYVRLELFEMYSALCCCQEGEAEALILRRSSCRI
ncbi:hypothetical protein VU01_11136 [Candidatus Electrothrix marina]|uniref:Uncharacterized protein n=1 Tax=Candidatus Electrothrix marina TaxID=1859130 RepID=A0A444JES0_9BACT|nr:hypothetical protein VU01_11136 [Candidatus Electrothrix marina]